MPIVDSQVHIWAADSPERPWPARHEPHRPEPITADDLLREMAAAGVDRVVLVPPSWEGERNDVVLAAARAHPERFAVMGRLDPEAPQSRAALREWRAQPGMLGLRFTFHRPSLQPLLTEGRADWVWAEAERLGIPVMLTCPHAILHHLERIAERHPGLRLTLDHLGLLPGTKDEEAFRDFDKLLALARLPGVAVKASALPCYTSDAYPYRRLHPYIERAVAAFGPERVFWGTDLSRLPCSYRQAVAMFAEEMPWLGAREKDEIMGRALCRWLGWLC
ncbi:MAG TPA: amidohydrolase family protein [Burkholderiales bacterium]|nr:amidohydrolase family protein [Burkholderiales bacterium]